MREQSNSEKQNNTQKFKHQHYRPNKYEKGWIYGRYLVAHAILNILFNKHLLTNKLHHLLHS